MNIAITGATSGIGWETAKALLQKGHKLFFLVRDIEKANKLLAEEPMGKNVTMIACDLADLAHVQKAAQGLSSKLDQLDVLINNAGGTFNERKESKDGHEMHLAVNHLGHFLLTKSLIDLLKSSKGKVINVSSEAHKAAKLDFENIEMKENYSIIKAYANAKMYNILFTKSLVDRGLTSYSLHPGVIDSSFGDNLNPILKFLWTIGKPFMKSSREGASTSIYLAINTLDPSKNGAYFKDRKLFKSSDESMKEVNRERLWEKSEELVESSLN